MKLPTNAEYEAAAEVYLSEPQQPVAATIDASPEMMMLLGRLTGEILTKREDVVHIALCCKTLMVLGLNIGMRIGEARPK